MPTVIDELVVEVGLDGSKFEGGRRDLEEQVNKSEGVLENFGKKVEAGGHKISDVFSITKRGVAGIVAAFVGGEAAAFIDRVATMDAHTMQLARSIGTSTRELSGWQNMVRAVGGTAADASATFAGLNDAFMGMTMGNQMPSAPFASLMGRAGIDFRQADPSSALQNIMGFLQNQPEKDQRFWLQQVPGMNESMMFLLMEIMRHPEKMKDLRGELEKLGLASQKSGEAALDLAEKTAELETAWESLARSLFPILTFLVNAANKITAIFGALNTGKAQGAGEGVLGEENSRPAGYYIIKGIVGPKAADELYGLGTELPDPLRLPSATGPAPATKAPAPPRTSSSWFGTSAEADTLSRGDRNNNPGNIRYGSFAQAHGASGQDSGGFAVFPDFRSGAAAAAQLLHDSYQGLTLAQIQKRWVGNPDTGYLADMMKSTGLGADAVPNLNDPNVVASLLSGMMKGEGTHHLQRGDAPATSSKTSSVTVGSINITSNKADPKAVADEVPDSIKRYSMLAGVNTGLV